MQKNAIALIVCSVIVLIVNIIFIPREEYLGDPVAIRYETIHFIKTGKIEVPDSIGSTYGDRGQYFYFNDKKGTWHSKYGIFNTLIYVPILFIEKIFTNDLSFTSNVRIFYINLFNLIISLISVIYLFSIFSIYTNSISVKFISAFGMLYGTFWWNYLRAQSSEIYQVLFVLMLFYHLIALKNKTKTNYLHLITIHICLLILVCIKSYYILFIVPILLLGIYIDSKNFQLKTFFNLKSFLPFLLRWVIPSFGIFCILLFVNYYKFGGPFITGYQQWAKETNMFSGNVFIGIWGFLFSPTRSIFLHFPVLLIAIPSFWFFLKKFSPDFFLSISFFLIALLTHSFFINWQGEWCYGPRYLLPVLPLLIIPMVFSLQWLIFKLDTLWRAALTSLSLSILIFSAFFQFNVNYYSFFMYYELKLGVFASYMTEEMQKYFENRPFGCINNDLRRYQKNLDRFEPIEIVKQVYGFKAAIECEKNINHLTKKNINSLF